MSTEPKDLLVLIRAEMESAMAKLELRLVDRFAGKKDHDALEARVTKLERFRYGIPSLALIATLASVGMLAYYLLKK